MSKQACKRMRRAIDLPISRDPLPSYAWPGGYPLYYVTSDGGALCPDCVNREIEQIDQSTRGHARDGWALEGFGIHYEGAPIVCDHCGKEIESAYGIPE